MLIFFLVLHLTMRITIKTVTGDVHTVDVESVSSINIDIDGEIECIYSEKENDVLPNKSKYVCLNIKTLTCKTFAIRVKLYDTIRDVKKRIQILEGVPIKKQRLIVNGTKLEDEKTVHDYDIGKQTIHLVPLPS